MLMLSFEVEQLPGLRETLDRAMNTWEPDKWPSWLLPTSDLVDSLIEAERCNAPSAPAS